MSVAGNHKIEKSDAEEEDEDEEVEEEEDDIDEADDEDEEIKAEDDVRNISPTDVRISTYIFCGLCTKCIKLGRIRASYWLVSVATCSLKLLSTF
jgi:hypothetical protein